MLAAERAHRDIEQQILAQQGIQVQHPRLGYRQQWILGPRRRIYEKVAQLDLQGVIIGFQAAYTLKGDLGLQQSLAVEALSCAGESKNAAQGGNLYLTIYLYRRKVEVEIAAETDTLIEQEADVQPQWITTIQMRTSIRKAPTPSNRISK